MTVKTETRSVRLSLSILGALSIAACSDTSSPTGPSPLPPTAHVQQAQFSSTVSTNPAPQPETEDFVQRPEGGYTCANFGEVRLRVLARGPDVVVQYAVDGVPRPGYYWVRFWPNGRNNSEPIDHIIGVLDTGDNASGEYVVMTLDSIDRKVTLNYNVDVDVAIDRQHYEDGVTAGQCDRGGELCIEPPPEPPVCGERALTIDGMKLDRIDYGNVRVYAYASASNFDGTVELEWQNMGHRELVATAELNAECDGTSVELRWETDRSWARFATFIVRIRDAKGRIVDSKTYEAGALKNGHPDTWILT